MLRRLVRRVLGTNPTERVANREEFVADWRAKADRSPFRRRMVLQLLFDQATDRAEQGQHDGALEALDEAIALGRAGSDDAETRWMLAIALNRRAGMLWHDRPDSCDEMRALNAEALVLIAPWSTSRKKRRQHVFAQVYEIQGLLLMLDDDHEAALEPLIDSVGRMMSAYRPLTADHLSAISVGLGNIGLCFRAVDMPEMADEFDAIALRCAARSPHRICAGRCPNFGRRGRASATIVRRSPAELRSSYGSS